MSFDLISYAMGPKSAGGGGGGGGGAVDKSLQNAYLLGMRSSAGFIGGFGGSNAEWQPYNAANTSRLVVDWSKSWTMHLRFKFTALDTDRRECLYGTDTYGVYFPGTLTAEVLNNGDWWFGFSTDGTSWGTQTAITPTEIPYVVGTVYTLHIVYDGSTIAINLSDGEHTASRSLTLADPLYFSDNYKLAFGNIAQSGALYARYTYFDPDDCYIESQGSMVWGSKR